MRSALKILPLGAVILLACVLFHVTSVSAIQTRVIVFLPHPSDNSTTLAPNNSTNSTSAFSGNGVNLDNVDWGWVTAVIILIIFLCSTSLWNFKKSPIVALNYEGTRTILGRHIEVEPSELPQVVNTIGIQLFPNLYVNTGEDPTIIQDNKTKGKKDKLYARNALKVYYTQEPWSVYYQFKTATWYSFIYNEYSNLRLVNIKIPVKKFTIKTPIECFKNTILITIVRFFHLSPYAKGITLSAFKALKCTENIIENGEISIAVIQPDCEMDQTDEKYSSHYIVKEPSEEENKPIEVTKEFKGTLREASELIQSGALFTEPLTLANFDIMKGEIPLKRFASLKDAMANKRSRERDRDMYTASLLVLRRDLEEAEKQLHQLGEENTRIQLESTLQIETERDTLMATFKQNKDSIFDVKNGITKFHGLGATETKAIQKGIDESIDKNDEEKKKLKADIEQLRIQLGILQNTIPKKSTPKNIEIEETGSE